MGRNRYKAMIPAICEDCSSPTLAAGTSPRSSPTASGNGSGHGLSAETSMNEGCGGAWQGRGARSPAGSRNSGQNRHHQRFQRRLVRRLTSNIVAAAIIGYDQPRSLGSGAFGGGMCGAGVPTVLCRRRSRNNGGGNFAVCRGLCIHHIDRFTRRKRLSVRPRVTMSSPNVSREGEFINFGITFDGGFGPWGRPAAGGRSRRSRARK